MPENLETIFDTSSSLTGTLGVVLKLHRQKLATRSLEQDLQTLSTFGMYLTDELKAVVLESL